MHRRPALLPGLPLIALGLAAAGAIASERPGLFVRYHGIFVDDTGAPSPGTLELRFRAFAQKTPADDETPLWTSDPIHTETMPGGQAVAEVGPLPEDLFRRRDEVWFGLSVNGEPDLSPRIRLGAMPVAHVARVAQSLSGRSHCDCTTVPLAAGALAACTEGRIVTGLGPAGMSCCRICE